MIPRIRQTLLHVFPTFAVGGAQMRLAALANHFGDEFAHVVLAMDGRTDCRERFDPRVHLTFPRIGLKPRDTIGTIFRFRRLLSATRPDRLITYNWGSIECAMANELRRTPHIHIEDGFGPEEADKQMRRRVLTRRFVLRRSTVVLPSKTLYRLACDVWKLNPVRLRHIPNGIDCARFGAADIAAYDWSGGGPIIGTVAALRPEKNLMRLLDAFRWVRERMECRLLIAGDGPERSRLEARAVELGIGGDVRFAGAVGDTERIYAALTVFVLSSDTEQLPTTVIEAMAAGLPVAGTNVGDVAEMVAPPNQPYVTPLNAVPLGQAILDLLKNPAAARSVGAANKDAARAAFGQDRMFAAYRTLFREELKFAADPP
ncbi:MAG: glycosyltransferase [Alphaproteobacteria bacterium]|nr:glycosyltransferase [Alphaproteobacteria bacterium]